MSRRGTSAVWAVIAITGWLGSAAAQEGQAAEEQPPREMQIRNYDHFEFDTATGTYLGLATFYTQDDKVILNDPVSGAPQGISTDNETTTGELRLTMGGTNIQGGIAIPYHLTSGDALDGGDNDIGNVRAHLKFIPLRRELFDVGAGLMLIFPGGAEDEGISVPNIGTLPFVTGTTHLGPVDLNAHIGYTFYNHNGAQRSPESILYGSTLGFAVLDNLGLRLELAGQQFTSGEDRNVVAIQPGLDFVVPIGDYGLQLSAAGSYGLSGGAAGDAPGYSSRYGLNTLSGLSRGEWGIGAAIGFLWY